MTINPTKEKKVAFYLYTNPWNTYIQPLFKREKEEQLIYIGKADEMKEIYYGEFDLVSEDNEAIWENAEKIWIK